MEQPTALPEAEVAAVRGGDGLNTLSTRSLLDELQLPLPRHYSVEGGLTVKAYKDKVLRLLLSRDIADFNTEELSLFLRVCPTNVNNSKPVQHAERALLGRMTSLSKVELVELLKWVASSSTLGAEQQQHKDKLLEVLLSRKFEELEPADFFVMMPLSPPERQQQIMAHLYHLRQQLDSTQMLQLMKLYFVTPPCAEIQGLMNALYENETKKKKLSQTRLVSFLRPAHQVPQHLGTLHAAAAASEAALDGGHQQPFAAHLQPHPTLPAAYYLDATFNPITEAQVASEKLGGSSSYALTLVERLPSAQHGVALFLSLPPFTADKRHFLGCLSENKPLLSLTYPLPIVGAVTAVRFLACVMPLEAIEKQYPTSTQQVAATGVLAQQVPAGGSPLPLSRDGEFEVTVCFGETHVFRLQKRDDFDELLKRAARRWNVSPAYHELQDNNFRTLDGTRPVADTVAPNTIIRLTRRGFADASTSGIGSGGAGLATPAHTGPFTTPLRSPSASVFAQQPPPTSSPFGYPPLYKQ